MNNIMFMTKKEFKERASVHVYGNGKRRRVRLFFDWKSPYGFKYRIMAYGVTKHQILNDAYDMIFKDIDYSLWYYFDIAQTDEQRMKVPVCG